MRTFEKDTSDQIEELLTDHWRMVAKIASDPRDDGRKMRNILEELAIITELDNEWHLKAK